MGVDQLFALAIRDKLLDSVLGDKGEPTPLPLFDVLAKWATIRGYVMMEITSDPARLERAKKFVNDGLADGSFKPLVAKTFPLDKIVEAHRFLESNQQIGKIVVTV